MNIDKFQKIELQLQGKKVSYLQSGNGPTILFLHGFGIGTIIWSQICQYINQNTIILLDLPGYGLNTNIRIAPEFDTLNEFVCDFIEKKGSIDYLVGYSLSGVLSYRIAQNPPTSIKKIICVSTPIFYSRFVYILQWIFRAIGFHPLITKIFKFLVVRFPVKHLLFFLGGLASVTDPNAMNNCMKKFNEESNQSYVFLSASTIFFPTRPVSISFPIEFIYGERDGFANPSMAKKAQLYCENSRLHIVKDVYHTIQLENPQELARLIEKVCK